MSSLWTEDDDLERIQCEVPGTPGHVMCGWCGPCDGPRFVCGHAVIDERSFNEGSK